MIGKTRYHVFKVDAPSSEQVVSCWESPDGAIGDCIRLNASCPNEKVYDYQTVTTCDGKHPKAPA